MATSTIGATGTYSTIQAWEDAMAVTLTAPEVGQLQNQSFPAGVTFAGTTTSGTNTITLECVAGASFRDNASKATNPMRPSASAGAIVEMTAGYVAGAITVQVPNVTIRNLQVDLSGSPSQAIKTTAAATNFLIDSCVLRSRSYTVVVLSEASQKIVNCAVIQAGGNDGIGPATAGAVWDCTIVRAAGLTASGVAVAGLYGNCDLRGSALFNFASATNGTAGNFGSSSGGNATDLASIGVVGGTNLTSQSYSSSFVDSGTTAANIDLRIPTGSPLKDAGLVITGVSADIIGTTRPQGTTPDIGAWEFAVAAGGPVTGAASPAAVSTLTGAATLSVAAAANPSAVSTLTGAASTPLTGAASPAAVSTLTGGSSLALAGASSAASVSTLTGSATLAAIAAGSASSVSTLTGSATLALTASAAPSAVATLTGTGTLGSAVIGASAMASVATLTGAASLSIQAFAAAATTSNLAGSASLAMLAAAYPSSVATLTGNGYVPSSGGPAQGMFYHYNRRRRAG